MFLFGYYNLRTEYGRHHVPLVFGKHGDDDAFTHDDQHVVEMHAHDPHVVTATTPKN